MGNYTQSEADWLLFTANCKLNLGQSGYWDRVTSGHGQLHT